MPEEAREQYLLDNSCSSKLSLFLQRVAQNKNANSISTGFKRLDTELGGGLFEGLYVIGGISSLGKSAFALQMADNIAGSGRDVMFFVLEMSTDELIARSISRETYEGINDKTSKSVDTVARTTRDILNGNDGGNQEVINNAINRYKKYNEHIFFFDQDGKSFFTPEKIREAIEKHFRIMGSYPVVFIDYLQIIESDKDNRTDKQVVDDSVLILKNISKKCNVPVVAVSSLNRASYSREISQEAFKEYGAIEYVCDSLIGLQFTGRPDINDAKREDPRKIEAVILKQRNGAVGTKIQFDFHAKYNFFEETK